MTTTAPTTARDGERIAAARDVVTSTAGASATLSRINRIACRLLAVSRTQVSIVTGDRQVAIAGYDAAGADDRQTQTPLSAAVCPAVVAREGDVLIPDALAIMGDPLAANAAAAGVRAYAGVPVTDGAGHVVGAFCALHDGPRRWTETEMEVLHECAALVGEAVQAIRELRAGARIDPLTGLLTTAMLRQTLERLPQDAPAAVLAIGVDGLQLVNDAHGYDAGDALLCGVADRLRESVRGDDVVARDEGDVFLVALGGHAGAGEVEAGARRLQEALSGRPYAIGSRCEQITVEIGVARNTGAAADGLVEEARAALRLAKARGARGPRSSPGDLADRARRRLELQTELAGAAERGELHLAYQPIVAIQTGDVVGTEALLRWTHPVLGPVSPGEFIPVAESSGAIVDLGAWVLDQACRDVARWRRLPGWSTFEVGINAAPLELSMPGYADGVERALDRHGLPARALVVEITERTLLTDGEQERAALERLCRQGMRIAIDDFGTGYSTLSTLLKTPASILKLDRSFVDAMTEDPRAQSVVGAVIGMATGMDLRAVAEGIETEAQRERLLDAGFVLGQGFLFARPMPADEIETLLLRRPVAA